MFVLVHEDGNVSASGAKADYLKAWYGTRRDVEKLQTGANFEDKCKDDYTSLCVPL